MTKIGLFDSGVGGLSVLRHVQAQLPDVPLLYIADQAHVPYGSRSLSDIRQLSDGITRFLLAHGANLIVVACNTASGAALTYLRQTFPDVPFVGMEPAVKPAAATTKSGKVGILATSGTFESQRYHSLMARFAQDVEVFENPCVGLVDLIEAGEIESEATAVLLRRCVQPMLDAGVDTLVLGCTHYPFVLPVLRKIVGTAVAIIDPAPAVARQVSRIWQQQNVPIATPSPPLIQAITTGDPQQFTRQIQQLLGNSIPSQTAIWQNNILI